MTVVTGNLKKTWFWYHGSSTVI